MADQVDPAGHVARRDVTFESAGDTCAAWWYEAAGSTVAQGDAPCVVMAHGFSMTRGDGLADYAERFAAAGVHVLVFDYRFFGDSGGAKRQRFRMGEQRDDWRNAIEFARSRPGVDPKRIVLWGFSFSGGHVAELLIRGVDVAAAIVTCPFVDGIGRVLVTSPKLIAWIIPRAVLDAAGRHTLIPVTAEPGGHAAMTLPGEAAGFAASMTHESAWRNEVSPAVFLTVALLRSAHKADRISVPLWVGHADKDISAPGRKIDVLAERAPKGELFEFEGDHFAAFHGQGFETVVGEQVAFLRRTVLAPVPE